MKREEIVDAMAMALSAKDCEGSICKNRCKCLEDASDALTALEAAIPGLKGLIEGTHVVVQNEQAITPYYERQIEWSRRTFGPEKRTFGVLDHIRKELGEIAQKPDDLTEWADVIILAMDGFWRHGGTVESLMEILLAKQKKNFARQWPDWRTMSADKAIEHDRSQDRAMIAAAEVRDE